MKRKNKFNSSAPLSNYARYYLKYAGYSFRNKMTGKVYSKGDFWDCFNKLATLTILTDLIVEPEGFELIKNKTKS